MSNQAKFGVSTGIALFLISVLVLFTSFKPFHGGAFGKKDWIPEDFNPKNVTLLIQEHPYTPKWNTGMIKWLEQEYPWKFEVVNADDYEGDPKYDDMKTYPFVFVWSDLTTNLTKNKGGIEYDSAIGYKDLEGNFYDRVLEKNYPKSGYAVNRGQGAYKKIFLVLISKIKDGK